MRGRILFSAAALIASACTLASAAPAFATTAGGGSVSGKIVSKTTGKPISGICVNIVKAPGNESVATSAATSKTGAYTVSGIPAGTTYTAFAFNNCSSKGDYVGQWWDEKEYQSEANQFTVTAGSTTSGIDFSLSPGGKISGKVTNAATKKPVEGILAVAFSSEGDHVASYSVCTSSKGKYTLTSVPPGSVKVVFWPNDCGIESNFNEVWYSDSPTYESATDVSVVAGNTTKDINQAVSE